MGCVPLSGKHWFRLILYHISDGKPRNDERIDSSLATVKYLLCKGTEGSQHLSLLSAIFLCWVRFLRSQQCMDLVPQTLALELKQLKVTGNQSERHPTIPHNYNFAV
jgi:hypothetical protein